MISAPAQPLLDVGFELNQEEGFRERFVASYGTLSEREPPLSEVEAVILEKLADMLEVNTNYARTMLETLLSKDAPASATFNYILGNLYFENEEYILAEAEYKKAIEKHPDFQRAWTNLGVLKLRGDDIPAALDAFSKSVSLGDVSSGTYGRMAYCHYRLGNYMSAEAAYTMAIMNDPGNTQWIEGKVEVYMDSNRFNEAARMIDELIVLYPTNHLYWLAQSNAYLAMDQLEKAARNLEVVHRLGGARPDSLDQLASLYTRLGIGDLAVQRFLQAAASEKNPDPQRLVEAALSLQDQGDLANATRLLEVIESNASANDSTESTPLFHRLKASLAEAKGLHDEAIKHWERALEQDPLSGEILLRLVALHKQYGSRDKAYMLAARAMKSDDSRFEALLTHSKLLIEDQRFAESLAPLSEALQLRSSEGLQNLYSRVKQASEASQRSSHSR